MNAWQSFLQQATTDPKQYAEQLRQFRAELQKDFEHGTDIEELVERHTQAIDLLLQTIWQQFDLDGKPVALVAVGGYGRGELHPHSDIDLLVLLESPPSTLLEELLEQFLTFLWDIGLDIGHSVRTLDECTTEAENDLTVITNLMESRHLAGDASLHDQLATAIANDKIWPGDVFFSAKLEEQKKRYQRFGETAYRLEPNLKESPGGLRDLHMIGWVTKRHFQINTLEELLDLDFLTKNECTALKAARNFLWRIRFGLHQITGRKEDRLLFDYQHDLAKMLGYDHLHRNEAIEAFMQDYYRTVMQLQRLQEMLLQLFDEAILHPDETLEIVRLNRRFHVRQGYLEVSDKEVFVRKPFALLELFLLLQQHPEIVGVRAETIRLVRDHLYLIDDHFRQQLTNRSLFIEILRQPKGVTHEFRRMNTYGVLGAYLPAFDAIVGRMQFDLFHIYTIDEHILMVLRNVRRLSVPEFADELPECSRLFHELPKPELLYLAALFHDIGKGRGGDHSELGEVDAREFCQAHGLSDYDTNLVAWLVRHHLVMSVTAQHKDISDPDVIQEFATLVNSTNRLKYLYLLTVSDIRGTDPALWNSWKASLLSSLYHRTYNWLTHKQSSTDIHQTWLRDIQQEALRLIAENGGSEAETRKIWQDMHDEYFRRFSPEEIAWHAQIIRQSKENPDEVIFIQPQSTKGATEILIYAPVHPRFFTLATHGLEQLGLNIVNARIYTTRSGMAIDSFMVLDSDDKPCEGKFRLQEIRERLDHLIKHPEHKIKTQSYKLSRHQRSFETPTRILFQRIKDKPFTELTITTADRRGLLADIAQALYATGSRIKMAKIATIGAEAHDVLHITNRDHKPLTKTEEKALQQTLLALIEPE